MSTKLADDIAYLKDIAESGTEAPSLSGRFALLWYGLLSVALILHWALARTLIPGIGIHYVGLVWFGMVVIGNIAAWFIARSLRDLPGQNAPNNKVGGTTWLVSGIGLALFSLTLMGTVFLRPEIPPLMFDMIIPTAFLVYAVNYAAPAAFTSRKGKWLPVGLSILASLATLAMIGIPELYLIAAAWVTSLWVTTGLPQLREEPKTTV